MKTDSDTDQSVSALLQMQVFFHSLLVVMITKNYTAKTAYRYNANRYRYRYAFHVRIYGSLRNTGRLLNTGIYCYVLV